MKRPILEIESVVAILIAVVFSFGLYLASMADVRRDQIKMEELRTQRELYKLTFTKLSQ